MEPVERSIEGIKAWMAANAPERAAVLRPPATEARIEDLERRLDVRLPDDLRAAYLVHDGQEGREYGFFVGRYWLSLDEMAEAHSLLIEGEGDLGDQPEGPVQSAASDPAWVPFSVEGGGSWHCVDLNPTPLGRSGQVIYYSFDCFPPHRVAASFADFLAEVADEYESGRAAKSFDLGTGEEEEHDEEEGEPPGTVSWVNESDPTSTQLRASWSQKLRPTYSYEARIDAGRGTDPAPLPPDLAAQLAALLPESTRGRGHVVVSAVLTAPGTPRLAFDLYLRNASDDPYEAMTDFGDPRTRPRLLHLDGEEARTSPWLAWLEATREAGIHHLSLKNALPFTLDELPEALRPALMAELARVNEMPDFAPGPPETLAYRFIDGDYPGPQVEVRPLDDAKERDWTGLEIEGLDRQSGPAHPWIAWFLAHSDRWVVPEGPAY